MKRPGRNTVLILVGLGLAAAGATWVPDPAEGFVVCSWIGRGPAWVESPGLKWKAPILVRQRRYSASPIRVEAEIRRQEGDAPVSREGAAVRISIHLTLAADPAAILTVHASLGTRYRDPDEIASRLRQPLRETASKLAYQEILSLGPVARAEFVASIQRATARIGLRLISLDDLATWPEIYAEGTGLENASDGRVLIVGLDGADWTIVDPLITAGKMPNLARIVSEGVRARLKTVEPVLSPIVWTSIATGKRPEKHGIMDFLAVDSRTGTSIPVTSSMRTARAFWGILSTRGVSVGTVAWWATWPAEPVLGFQVSDRVAYQVFSGAGSGEGLRGRTYPEGLMLALARDTQAAREAAREDAERLLGRPPRREDQDEQALLEILASTRIYHGAALKLLREYRPRVAAVYYEGTDTIAHLFMRYAPPRLAGVTSEQVARWGDVLERYYLLQDRFLGEVIEAMGPGSSVIVVSDHGFKNGSTRPQSDPRIGVGAAADWHRKFGVFAAAGRGFRRGVAIADISVLDIAPTLLALLGLPVAADMDGVVAAEALEPLASRPPSIATYEGEGPAHPGARGGPGAAADDPTVEGEMIAKLTALGYIGQTGANAENNIGLTLLRQGRVAEAEEAFRTALRKDHAFHSARVNLARAMIAKHRYADALKELKAVSAADPNALDVDNLIGNILMETGDARGAEATFRRALASDGRNPHLWNSLGIVMERLGRQQEAIDAYRHVVEIDADYAEAINNIGLVYRAQGRSREAIGEFEKARKADPDFPGSYNNMGLVYQDLNDIDAAIRAYDDGLRVDPENPVILNSRGSALMAVGRTAEARTMFERALAGDPNYPAAQNNLGAALGALGDAQGEFEGYLKAIEADPNYMDARFNLALNLSKRGRPAEALKALGELLRREPDHVRALVQEALLQANLGQTDAALASATRARDLAPRWTVPRNILARVMIQAGRRGDALREARISLELDPNQPEIRALLDGAARSLTSGSKP